MRCSITHFPRLLEPRGQRVNTTWSRLIERFRRPFEVARKEDAPGWSPAIYEGDSRAAGTNPLALSALVLEHDEGATLDEAVEIWGEHYGCIYTTHSHRSGAPRFRIVIPSSRPITGEEHARLGAWARQVDPTIDTHVQDAKRFWFLPAHAPGAPFAARELTGAILDVDAVLRHVAPVAPPPASLPPPMRAPRGFATTDQIIDRAIAYIATMPPAISGQGGHAALYAVAVVLVHGFELPIGIARQIIASKYNPRGRAVPLRPGRGNRRREAFRTRNEDLGRRPLEPCPGARVRGERSRQPTAKANRPRHGLRG